ncbi:Centromere protein H (CENP-H) [Geosmithia morbida]|uniref:Centromere protein H (CENP-H) n=1 Tax=Geosmithia morbida TaxID=1094350 RepID=A0A9P4YVY7_9HYPO|nr:Centromere protein H (CENP-H) [Geosmithia morbida]KAF4124101.1 Centromere protein H (CENP-H) [Geosmithia morbida]
MAIVQAQQKQQTEYEDMTPEQVSAARNQLIETRARYLLRNQVVDSVLSANPILKAVHNGVDASPVERDLAGYIQQRDEVAISLAKLASSLDEVRERATRAQSETHVVTRENTQLAAEVMDLVAQVNEKKSGHQTLRHEAVQQRDELQDNLKRSRERWRVMKGITSGVVAGSGVDWARDDKLRDLVLDPEDDEDI